MCARAAATDPKEADIIWTSTQVDEDMKKATGITDRQYVNQFPFEACLVMKHHLAETVHKVKKQKHCTKFWHTAGLGLLQKLLLFEHAILYFVNIGLGIDP